MDEQPEPTSEGTKRWSPVRMLAGVLIASGVIAALSMLATPAVDDSFDYAVFLTRVANDRVVSVEIHQRSGKISGVLDDGATFSAQGPPRGMPDAGLAVLDDHDVRRTYAAERSNILATLAVYLLPVVLIIGVIVWLSRRAGQQFTNASEWGMSDRLRHMAWGTQGPVFLGEDLIHTRDDAEGTARVIDEETTRILDQQAARAKAALAAHRALLDALASALPERESLDGGDVAAIVNAVETAAVA